MNSLSNCIGWGREALARGQGVHGTLPETTVAALLEMLWHEDREIRQEAVRSLPGGDRDHYHEMHYGYFAEAFLRELGLRYPSMPAEAETRYAAVAEVLGELIEMSTRDIRAMSGMHYSFLSSALYLAVFATCRDAVQATGRLRAAPLHAPLCGLLWNLSAVSGTGRLNPQDTLMLMDAAGRALAVLSPDEIPEFWAALSHTNATRRNAVSPALPHLNDRRAVPYLLTALPQQHLDLAERILVCLGRLEDTRAVSLLNEFARSSDWGLRRAARASLAAIQRAEKRNPVHTLLRPSSPAAENLLRSTGAPNLEAPNELLHLLPDGPPPEAPYE